MCSSRFPRDHHLSGLDDGHGGVAALEPQLVDGIARDDVGQRLLADSQPHLRQQSFRAHFLDNAAQLIAATERDNCSLMPL